MSDPQERPRTRPQPRDTYAIRLSHAERRLIVAAAAAREMTIAAYVRLAATETARRDLAAA